jgi:tetratricopeptide (TPR) repeat protein
MRLIMWFLATVVALPVAAQNEPRRPRLPADLDTNDAQAYVDWAYQDNVSWKDAAAAYYWAVRLKPDDPSLLHLRYLGLWYRHAPAWRREYAAGAKFVTKTREAREIDSLLGELLIRHPYPRLLRPCYLAEGLERQRDRALVGLIHWENGCYPQAVAAFGEALEKDGSQLPLRVYRARGYYFQRSYARAVTELNLLLDSLRARDQEHLAHWYDSKEMFEYMVGMAEWAAGRLQPAREAFGRALTEDLSFYMAHARLGAIARWAGDRDQAIAEYELAAGLQPGDAALRHQYGEALLDADRFADAEIQLREASRLEPYWAQPYFDLGRALMGLEQPADALAAFESFLARCPRRLNVQADRARQLVKTVQERRATGR